MPRTPRICIPNYAPNPTHVPHHYDPYTYQPPADPLLPAFRDFVTHEKQRLTQKRQALVKSEMDKRMAELVKFSLNFKVRSLCLPSFYISIFKL